MRMGRIGCWICAAAVAVTAIGCGAEEGHPPLKPGEPPPEPAAGAKKLFERPKNMPTGKAGQPR
jgi:hypothetical protein